MAETSLIKVLMGREIIPYIDSVSEFRIRFFREFPYLYAGSISYEKEYMKGYSQEPRSLLVILEGDENELQGFSTGMPLNADSDIVKEASQNFEMAGYDSSQFYYFGETILIPEQRGKGNYSRIVEQREREVKAMGFSQVCFMAVKREADHPQRPVNYREPGPVFSHMGYEPTDVEVSFKYPTVLPDGSSSERSHSMVYWIKALA